MEGTQVSRSDEFNLGIGFVFEVNGTEESDRMFKNRLTCFEVHLGTHREESDERETETELAGMASPATGWPVSAPPHRRNGKYR